jgi:hypothetical protein
MSNAMNVDKRSLTLNLSSQEMKALEELAGRKELSKSAVIRQAFHLYQLLDARIAQGDRLVIENEKLQKKAEVMML